MQHPSLPNYIALVSGSTQGITSDCTTCTANAPNLADQLEHAHRSWRRTSKVCRRPARGPPRAGRYAKKHDPFAYDDAIARDPSRCRRRVPLSRLDGDVRRDRLPDFAFIAPDLCHDTHDCSVATGDRFLAPARARTDPRPRPARLPRHHLRRGRRATPRCCGDSRRRDESPSWSPVPTSGPARSCAARSTTTASSQHRVARSGCPARRGPQTPRTGRSTRCFAEAGRRRCESQVAVEESA